MSRGYIGPPWWLMARGTGGYQTVSGPVAHWNDKVVAPLKSLVANIDPVQDLHGYDNPWPAGGGKNKFNGQVTITTYPTLDECVTELEPGTYTLSMSIANATSWRIAIKPIVEDVPSQTAISITSPTGYYWNTSGKAYLAGSDGDHRTVVFVVNTACRIGIGLVLGNVTSSTEANNVQVESGSTATSYAPYSNICPISGWDGMTVYHSGADTSDPTTYPISWQSAGTVYGGTLDVVGGKLIVDHAEVDLGTLTWAITTNRFEARLPLPPPIYSLTQIADAICSAYPIVSRSALQDKTACIYYGNVNGVNIRDSDYSTAADFGTAMSGVQLVYELATPIEYTLTPQQISSLLGENNLWADTGDVTVEYLSGSGNPALVALALARRDEEE